MSIQHKFDRQTDRERERARETDPGSLSLHTTGPGLADILGDYFQTVINYLPYGCGFLVKGGNECQDLRPDFWTDEHTIERVRNRFSNETHTTDDTSSANDDDDEEEEEEDEEEEILVDGLDRDVTSTRGGYMEDIVTCRNFSSKRRKVHTKNRESSSTTQTRSVKPSSSPSSPFEVGVQKEQIFVKQNFPVDFVQVRIDNAAATGTRHLPRTVFHHFVSNRTMPFRPPLFRSTISRIRVMPLILMSGCLFNPSLDFCVFVQFWTHTYARVCLSVCASAYT